MSISKNAGPQISIQMTLLKADKMVIKNQL